MLSLTLLAATPSSKQIMIPVWLHILSIISLLLGFLAAAIIIADEWRHPQHMWIMNLVWPLCALFGSVLWLWFYFRHGRTGKMKADGPDHHEHGHASPFPITVAKGTSHCGAGCTLGDICAEWLAFAFPAIAAWLGWQTIFSEKMFAVWILDFVLAYLFGVFFQYFSIAPMRDLGLPDGIWAAVKADTLSLTAWQIGMYGFMAVAFFWIFRDLLGSKLEVASPEFWFMMQIAMLCGFVTSYPVNWWLIKAGLKEEM